MNLFFFKNHQKIFFLYKIKNFKKNEILEKIIFLLKKTYFFDKIMVVGEEHTFFHHVKT